MMNRAARRWLPWVVTWLGLAAMIPFGDIGGDNRAEWAVAFTTTLAVAVCAGITLSREAMNLLVAAILVIAAIRSVRYAELGLWGPQGVWMLVLGTLLLAWALPHQQTRRANKADRRTHQERRTASVVPSLERRASSLDRRTKPPQAA